MNDRITNKKAVLRAGTAAYPNHTELAACGH